MSNNVDNVKRYKSMHKFCNEFVMKSLCMSEFILDEEDKFSLWFSKFKTIKFSLTYHIENCDTCVHEYDDKLKIDTIEKS